MPGTPVPLNSSSRQLPKWGAKQCKIDLQDALVLYTAISAGNIKLLPLPHSLVAMGLNMYMGLPWDARLQLEEVNVLAFTVMPQVDPRWWEV